MIFCYRNSEAFPEVTFTLSGENADHIASGLDFSYSYTTDKRGCSLSGNTFIANMNIDSAVVISQLALAATNEVTMNYDHEHGR